MCVIANSAGAETTPDDFLGSEDNQSEEGRDEMQREHARLAEYCKGRDWVPDASDLREITRRFTATQPG